MSSPDALRPSYIQVYEIEWERTTYAVATPIELAQFLIGVGRVEPDFRPVVTTRTILQESFVQYPTIPFDRFIG